MIIDFATRRAVFRAPASGNLVPIPIERTRGRPAGVPDRAPRLPISRIVREQIDALELDALLKMQSSTRMRVCNAIAKNIATSATVMTESLDDEMKGLRPLRQEAIPHYLEMLEQ